MFELKPIVRNVLLACGGAGALVLAGSASAQVVEKEAVVITGSRIASPNILSTSPITTINAEEIKLDGVRNVEDILNRLPQAFADYGSNQSNGATGTATINLRNLGSDRTLVLINGRRLPAGSPTLYATDLNQIPAALIQRIERLTGGASAVYGSDAVAGVVNFIMNDKFEGVQLDFNYGFYNHNQDNAVASIIGARNFPLPDDVGADGQTFDINLMVGGNFAGNKGNATAYLGFKRDKAVLQSQRDYSSCALLSNSANPSANFTCGGSSTSFPGRFFDLNNDDTDLTIADSAGNVRPFVAATDLYNYGPLNYYQRPSDRYSFGAFAHYDVAPFARVYTEAMFHDDHTVAQIAPSGLFGQVITIPFENPLLSDSFRSAFGLNAPGDTADLFILRRNVEGGGRQADLRHTSYRGALGVKGEVAKHWNYDVFGHYGRVVFQQTYKNDFSRIRSARALDVVTDPATGAPVCASVLDGTDPNCVPYNIFALGGVTPGALAYLQTPGLQNGYTQQNVFGASASADLGEYGVRVPTAKTGVSVVFGAERRTEKLVFEVDQAFSSDDLFGQGGATQGLTGRIAVEDYFTEVRVPLLEGRPFADLLAFNASYRYSDYSTGISTDTYGLGLEWAPVRTVRLRGSYQRAVRAANIIELFQPQTGNLFDMNEDPCATATPTRSLAECMRTGVSAAQYGSIIDSTAGQYNFIDGGNPLLEPEEATSRTFGVVLTPLPNLSLSLDYFNIKVKDVIDNAPPTLILSKCLDTGDPQFCNLITRDALGTLWATPAARIVATNQNLANRETSGIDFAANYNHRLAGYGSLGLNFVGTYLLDYKREDFPGEGKYDCAGLYGNTCGTPLPEWRHKARLSWATPWNVDVGLTWRYFKAVDLDSTSSDPQLNGPVADVDRTLPSQNYIDIGASWRVLRWLTVGGGINNLFDRDPPLTAQSGPGIFGNGNTFPQVYDSLGRRVFLNMTAKF